MSPSLRSSFPFNQDWFQEEDKYKPLCFCLNVTLGTGSFCLFGLFFFFPFHGWFSPSPPTPRQKIKNGIKKKCSGSFVVWNGRALWKSLQIPGVSLSALHSPILGNNASSHFRKHRCVHLTAPLSEALCQKQQRDTAKFQPTAQTRALKFCYLKFA